MYRLVSLSFLLEIFDLKYGDGEWRGWDWEPGGGEVRRNDAAEREIKLRARAGENLGNTNPE